MRARAGSVSAPAFLIIFVVLPMPHISPKSVIEISIFAQKVGAIKRVNLLENILKGEVRHEERVFGDAPGPYFLHRAGSPGIRGAIF